MSDLAQLAQSVRRTKTTLDQKTGEARALAANGQSVKAEIIKLTNDTVMYSQIAGILNTIGDARQEDAQRRIEGIVTLGLQTIFEENLSFHLVSTTKAKAVNVDFIVRTTLEDGTQIDTPVMDARGGGLVTVISFLLRLVVKLLAAPDKEHILFLDESFSHLSEEYEPRLAEFLREVVDKTKVQIVLVTHSSAYTDAADTVYRFKLVNGETKVTQE